MQDVCFINENNNFPNVHIVYLHKIVNLNTNNIIMPCIFINIFIYNFLYITFYIETYIFITFYNFL